MQRHPDRVEEICGEDRRGEKRHDRGGDRFRAREHGRNSTTGPPALSASLIFMLGLRRRVLGFLAMGKRDPRVDAYIAKSADFAKPILVYIREVVHAACPEVD